MVRAVGTTAKAWKQPKEAGPHEWIQQMGTPTMQCKWLSHVLAQFRPQEEAQRITPAQQVRRERQAPDGTVQSLRYGTSVSVKQTQTHRQANRLAAARGDRG